MLSLRQPIAEEAPALAELSRAATHGLLDVFYDRLIAGQDLQHTIIDRRILREGHLASLPYWAVVAAEDGAVMGGVNAFAFDEADAAVPDPLITPERLSVFRTLSDLERQAAGSYYINAIATFPTYQKQGVGRMLVDNVIRQATNKPLDRVTLSTFEADAPLFRWYQNLGFTVRDRRPIEPHPLLHNTGNGVLMELRL